jgi:hypothetical protein
MEEKMLDAYELETADFSSALDRTRDKIGAVAEALLLSASENPGFFDSDSLNGFGLILADAVADLEVIHGRLYGDGRTGEPVKCTAAPAVVENLERSTGL